jgi:hypothetical protein
MASSAPNAILAISSTDRYTSYSAGNANQPTSDTLIAQYEGLGPYSNNFSITAPNALINGYIEKIIISQIQLQYYLPTVIPGSNDTLLIAVETSNGSGSFIPYTISLPYGFYTPYELAALLQVYLNQDVYAVNEGFFEVIYAQNQTSNGLLLSNAGFTITLTDNAKRFRIVAPTSLNVPANVSVATVFKTYKLFGFTINNSLPEQIQYSWFAPVFLYTPYIDIYSDALTNYQKLKDTDSSTIRRKGLISRLYLSGVGTPQVTTDANVYNAALGSEPFVLTYDLNSPKIINWSPNTAVNSLDFQLRDCYGDLLFSIVPTYQSGTIGEVFNTEFQMTLLCIEGDR